MLCALANCDPKPGVFCHNPRPADGPLQTRDHSLRHKHAVGGGEAARYGAMVGRSAQSKGSFTQRWWLERGMGASTPSLPSLLRFDQRTLLRFQTAWPLAALVALSLAGHEFTGSTGPFWHVAKFGQVIMQRKNTLAVIYMHRWLEIEI